MSASLDAGDRRLLIGAGLFVVVLIVISGLATAPQGEQAVGFPSSYSAGWDGAKAAFLMLKEVGYPAERWQQPPQDIPYTAAQTVLVFAEPRVVGSPEERQAIRGFLHSGGRILTTGPVARYLVPDVAAEWSGEFEEVPRSFRPLVSSPLTHGVREIAMAATSNWTGNNAAQLVVFGEDKQAAVVTYRYGKGQVIWWAAPTPLTNGGIREKDNVALLLNCLGLPGEKHVLWDEYYHGARGSLLSYLGRTPLPWAAVQFGLLFLAALLTFSRRAGPVRAPVGESRLSPLEFVDTLGDLYSSAHAGASAVGIALERLRCLLTRQLGLPSHLTVSELCRSAGWRLGWNEPALLDTLGRAERAMRNVKLSDAEALELVQQLHDYTARFEVRRSSPGEKRG